MLAINNSPAFKGTIFNGENPIAWPTAIQDNNMLQAVSDELVLTGAVKKSEITDGNEGKDTRTRYGVGDRFEITTVIGPTNTREGMGGMRYNSHDLKNLEFGYENATGDKCVWKFDPRQISERLKENFIDLLTSDDKKEAIQAFMNVLKGQTHPVDSF